MVSESNRGELYLDERRHNGFILVPVKTSGVLTRSTPIRILMNFSAMTKLQLGTDLVKGDLKKCFHRQVVTLLILKKPTAGIIWENPRA